MLTHQIGIRQLVEFLLKTGDLNATQGSDNTLAMGSKIHRKLQRNRNSNYQAEVNLKTTLNYLNEEFIINGRADGIYEENGSIIIEEIKTSDLLFENLPTSTLDLYWGQVKIYAYIYMLDQQLKQINLQLTYVQTPDEIITNTMQTITFQEAQTFFEELMREYRKWIKLRKQLNEQRIHSAQRLAFPYDHYRPGQRQLAVNVYKSIALKKQLFVEAPTGTGKTISTLFPTMKAMGENLISRCFYLIAKQSTRQIAADTLAIMKNSGLKVKSIVLTAKDKIEFESERDLAPEENPYMLGYYDRIRPAIMDIITHEDSLDAPSIQKYSQKHSVDPFEFSLDVSLFCDVIICDYNHLFDPQTHLQRYFSIYDEQNCFLIDEVHNLVNRAREMYSSSLDNDPINDLIKSLDAQDEKDKSLIKRFQSLKRSFSRYGKIDDLEKIQTDSLDNFNKTLNKLTEAIHNWLGEHSNQVISKELLDYYFKCRHFLLIQQFYDETFRTKITVDQKSITFKIFCLDPGKFIDESLQLGRAAILFSATLSPLKYYQKVLGNNQESLAQITPSPFSYQQSQTIILDYINTTYKSRKDSILPICDAILKMTDAKSGHYLIFFPSLKYLNQVHDKFSQLHPEIPTIVQTSSMDQQSRQAFLDQFSQNVDQILVGFALLGGIFSEGIDLKGRQLIGVGIVSVGLPKINSETDQIMQYYDQELKQGFSYAYQLPGFNNVSQAAGRVIRTNADLGVIVLMDQRFTQPRYRKLFPHHWQNLKIASNGPTLKNYLTNFWQNVN
ncbi:ATP-dependent DNA helicase [Lentilactobacillus laojiaonis]|uniref:ATP-dependent DNA helicase n=1 Tax=Lentilactobacillus laojiaonis TaxID=2883998 RepID=UPI001D0BAB16|nr:ATP-dependent DNA helicase [Lentilactobacillus laojiaonis]UDM32280.1 ATP-dependent DNA helicase [Lentilactobacillus laojiaonis]